MANKIDRRKEIINYIIHGALYVKFDVTESDYKYLSELFTDSFNFHLFCKRCKIDSVFNSIKKETNKRMITAYSYIESYSMDEEIPVVKKYRSKMMAKFAEDCPFALLDSKCALCKSSTRFYFAVNEKYIMKIGQYPSSRDLGIVEINKYEKLLKNEYNDYDEFCTALRAYAAGAGIGSYVYLRRVLEHIIEYAHQRASIKDGWDEKQYKDSRVDKKIKMLGNELSEHSLECLGGLYNILSKGIHQLSEEECSKHFDLMKNAIISIMEEEIYKTNTEKLHTEIRKNLNKVKSEIN